jgi:hypothetical protein
MDPGPEHIPPVKVIKKYLNEIPECQNLKAAGISASEEGKIESLPAGGHGHPSESSGSWRTGMKSVDTEAVSCQSAELGEGQGSLKWKWLGGRYVSLPSDLEPELWSFSLPRSERTRA